MTTSKILLLLGTTTALFWLLEAASTTEVRTCECFQATCGSDTITEEESAMLEELQAGLSILQELGEKTLLNGRSSKPQCKVAQSIVCFAHDRFQHYSRVLLDTRPDDDFYSAVIGNHFVAWSVLSSSCKWLGLYSSPNLTGNCSLTEISDMCLDFKLYQLATQVQDDFVDVVTGLEILDRKETWLEENLDPAPISIAEIILKSVNCSHENTAFTC